LFAGRLFAARLALYNHCPLILPWIEPIGIESNRQVVTAVAGHVHERRSQELKKRRLLLAHVEAMRLLTLILNSNGAIGLSVGRQLHFPGLTLLRGLLGPSLRGQNNCAGKQNGYE
jgi:hypothetical protein